MHRAYAAARRPTGVLAVLQGNFINNDPQMVPPGTKDWAKVHKPEPLRSASSAATSDTTASHS